MPSLEKKIIENFLNKKKYENFVETGTYNGDTIVCMENLFEKLYTIEISEKYFKRTRNKFKKKYPKINFILGDSSEVLLDLCKKLEKNTIFFLDGHYSSGDTGRGKKDCPLYEECDTINKFFKHDGVIIIDDCRLFGKDKSSGLLLEDWSEINKENILSIFDKRTLKYYFLPSSIHNEDRLILEISSI